MEIGAAPGAERGRGERTVGRPRDSDPIECRDSGGQEWEPPGGSWGS